MLGCLERLAPPLERIVTAKFEAKEGQSKADGERHQEQVRGGLRAVLALNAVPDAGSVQPWAEMVERISRQEDVAAELDVLRSQRDA